MEPIFPTRKSIGTNLGLYMQTGKSSGSDVNAFYAVANVGCAVTPKFKAALGYEFLSGKDQNDISTDFKSFTPLFGTNHGFNGFMDYFFVGNHQNNVGLGEAYLKLSYAKKKNGSLL